MLRINRINNMKNPYLNSGKRDTDVARHDWPVTTKSCLATVLKDEAAYSPNEINQQIHQLIRSRKALSDLRIALSAAKREWSGLSKMEKKVSRQIAKIISSVKKLSEMFPLTVK